MAALPAAAEVDSEAALGNAATSANHSKTVALLPTKKRPLKRVASQPSSSAPRFDELDALRGFCTCIVVTGHFWFAFGDGVNIPGLINASMMSLDVFFTMSGYVIAYSYLLNGKVKSLLSAAFRRGPRLVFPALCANLLALLFSKLGAFNIHTQWRKLRYPDGTWCVTCFGTQVGPEMSLSWALVSAKNLVGSFGEGSWSFPWQWTIPVELYGSGIVFLCAPFLRWFVNFRVADLDEPGPIQLQRCLFLSSVCLLGLLAASKGIQNWLLSLAPPLLPDGSSADDNLYQTLALMVDSKTRTAFLFVAGMTLAQAHIIIRSSLQCQFSWADEMRTKWEEMYITKWVIPLFFAVMPITLPALVDCVDNQSCPQPAIWPDYIKPFVLLAGPLSVMTGVLLSPREFRTRMGNSVFQFLGKISFSIYLMHFFVIFSLGMVFYVWLDHRFGHLTTLALVMAFSALPLLLLSYLFWLAVEDPLGMQLPRKAVAFLWQKLEKVQKQGGIQMLPVLMGDAFRSLLSKPI